MWIPSTVLMTIYRDGQVSVSVAFRIQIPMDFTSSSLKYLNRFKPGSVTKNLLFHVLILLPLFCRYPLIGLISGVSSAFFFSEDRLRFSVRKDRDDFGKPSSRCVEHKNKHEHHVNMCPDLHQNQLCKNSC